MVQEIKDPSFHLKTNFDQLKFSWRCDERESSHSPPSWVMSKQPCRNNGFWVDRFGRCSRLSFTEHWSLRFSAQGYTKDIDKLVGVFFLCAALLIRSFRKRSDAFQFQQLLFEFTTTGPRIASDSAAGHNTVTRNHQRIPVFSHACANGPSASR